MAGPMLLVGRTSISDTEGELPLKGRKVDIGQPDAVLGRRGPLTFVTWRLPLSPTISCGCNQTAIVAGRQLSEATVLAAARSARPLSQRPTITAKGVPEGLRSLGTLPGLGHADRWHNIDQSMEVLLDDTVVGLRVFGGDARLVPHLRFWTAGHRYLMYDTFSRVSRAEGSVIVTTQWGKTAPSQPDVDALLASLRSATRADVAVALRRALERPVDAADRCMSGTSSSSAATFAGSAGRGRWSVTLEQREGRFSSYCSGISYGTDLDGAGGGGGGPMGPPSAPSAIRVLSTDSGKHSSGERLVVVFGDVPATVTACK